MVFAAFAAFVTLFSAVGLVVDHRTLVGAPIWAKPCKFAFSFGLYAVTWAWMISLQRRHVRLGRVLGTLAAYACAAEVGAVFLQTLRGHRSHFNVATPSDTAVWAFMAASIAVLWVVNVVGAVLIMLERHADRPSLWALRLGTVITLAGMAVAFLMVWGTPDQLANPPLTIIGAHSVGVADGGPGLAVTGWSTTGGDLRVPHFIGVHGLQMVPLFALALVLLATRVRRLREDLVRTRLIWIFAGFYSGVMLLALWQALRQQPVTKPDLLTVGALSVLVAATMVLAGLALRATKKPVSPRVREEVMV
jgi:hypothetical protein